MTSVTNQKVHHLIFISPAVAVEGAPAMQKARYIAPLVSDEQKAADCTFESTRWDAKESSGNNSQQVMLTCLRARDGLHNMRGPDIAVGGMKDCNT
jgi:hypothetical protein